MAWASNYPTDVFWWAHIFHIKKLSWTRIEDLQAGTNLRWYKSNRIHLSKLKLSNLYMIEFEYILFSKVIIYDTPPSPEPWTPRTDLIWFLPRYMCTGYWPSLFGQDAWLDTHDQVLFLHACLWTEMKSCSINMQKKTMRPKSSHLDQTSLLIGQ